MRAKNQDAADPHADVVDERALPVIDLAAARDYGTFEHDALVRSIRESAVANGFFYLINHGIPLETMQGMLAQAKRLFSLDQDAKQAIAAKHSSGLGYGLMAGKELSGKKGDKLGKEEFYYARDGVPGITEKNQWPADLPGFREDLMAYLDQMHGLAETLMSLLAESLDLPADYFTDFCSDPLASVRLVRYPSEGAVAGTHTDFGALTFLLQDGAGGLQVYDHAMDGWIQAVPIPGSYVVNLGDLFEVWTNKFYRSTPHRVVHPAGLDRFSIPFFYTGAADYVVQCLPQFRANGPLLAPTTPAGHLKGGHEAQGF
ncbi:MAG TPA: 2OG-Fe(II) oxygenase family protein [Sphingomonas sp.]|nr:2OG-Fe(II) oxygenase family protein [Sphingomonas sp.]